MAGRILVLNTGSSSIKYELVDMRTRERPARGLVERAVSPPGAEVAVLVIPTDEEWEIASQALALLGS
ncbi:hypothetical protein [Nonomuraea sp. B19D2]|uniref:hypothetical protein n=1 Tax=Nonomuraea sp. B19D2 TaxID=3159561 RepID=UPI0032DAF979